MNQPGAAHPELARGRLPALALAFLLAGGIYLARISSCASVVLLVLLAASFSARFFPVLHPFKSRLTNLSFSILLVLCGFVLLLLHDRLGSAENLSLPLDGQEAGLAGHLLGPPWTQSTAFYGDRLQFYFQTEAVLRPGETDWRTSDYRVIASLPEEGAPELSGNERLAFPASLEPPGGYSNPGGFDWREYLASGSILAEANIANSGEVRYLPDRPFGFRRLLEPGLLALDLRAALFSLHQRLYPVEEIRQVASAMLIGTRNQVPEKIRANFTASGTVHVLVVSGLHAGFIAAAVYFFLSLFLGRSWAAALITAAAVFLFALTSGANPPVLRAAIMCATVLLALPLQRPRSLLNSLAAAFAILLLIHPQWLFEAGFQLSFAAVAGIALLVPPLESRLNQRGWWRNPLKRWLARLALSSFAAQLAITPLVAWYFFRILPIAFVANLLIVPLAGVTVTCGFIADLAGLIWIAPARLIAWPAALSLRLMIFLTRWFAALPGASFEVAPPGVSDIFFFWLILYLLAEIISRRRTVAPLLLTALVWLNFQLWVPLALRQDNRLLVRFLDLGVTEAPVLHLPGGSTLLCYPSGRKSGELRKVREIIAPYLLRHSGRKLDWLILRGSGVSDFSWAWQVLTRFEVGAVLLTHTGPDSVSFRRLCAWCGSRKIPLRLASLSDTLRAGDTKFFFCGSSESGGPESGEAGEELVPVAARSGRQIIFAGAAEGPLLEELARGRNGRLCEVLEWPRAFAKRGAGPLPGFLGSEAGPRYLISAEDRDYAGLPGQDFHARAVPLATAVSGAVSLYLGADKMKLETERPKRTE